MLKTTYANSHGLINPNNRSSAYDIAILSEYAMRNDIFRRVVSTQTYKGSIRVSPPGAKKRAGKMMFSAEDSGSSEEEE